jgi:hypothetical protein
LRRDVPSRVSRCASGVTVVHRFKNDRHIILCVVRR